MLLQKIKEAVKRKDAPLIGRTIKVGSYLVKVENVLGEGGYATIYRCTDNTTRAAFALKHFRLSGHPEALADVHQEVAVMRQLRECPYALHLRAVAFAGGSPGAEEEAFMLLDLCRDNLVAFLQARRFSLDDHTILSIFLPVCRAVQVMHSLDPPLAHRDLKAENVLLHTNGHWVLCDFGSSTSQQQVYSQPREIAMEEERIRKHTTPAYRAPEMWDLYTREFIGLKVDIWALGCLLYLLCFGRLPFDADAKLQILNGRYTLPPQRSEQLRSLIKAMLVVDSKQRLGIDEVVHRLEQLAPADLSRPLPSPASPQQHQAVASPTQGSFSSQGPRLEGTHPVPRHSSEAAAPHSGSRSFTQGSAAHAAAAPTPSPGPPQPSGGLFWQSQAAAAAGAASAHEDQGGWASFGSGDHGELLEASLGPPSGGGAPVLQPTPAAPNSTPAGAAAAAAGLATNHGSTPASGAQDDSWVSFNASPVRGPSSSQPQSSTPGPSIPPPAAEEGPLSAGFKALVSSAISPFSSSRQQAKQAPGSAGATVPPAQTRPTPPTEPIMGRMVIEPVPMPMGSGQMGVITPASSRGQQGNSSSSASTQQAGPGSQPHSRPSSETAPTRHAQPSPFKLGYAASGSSLPASPKHSRESSRTIDALSRSSGQGADDVEGLQLRMSQLEETCKVLEQLLEMKTEELMVLREQNTWQGQELARQAQEMAQLRRELEQQRAQGQQAPPPQRGLSGTPKTLSRSSSLGSARDVPLRVEVPSQEQAGSWISFNASGSLDQGAPTPTLLQPSASKLGSSQHGPQQAQQHPSPATPLVDLLQANLDLGPPGTGAGPGPATMSSGPGTALAPQPLSQQPQQAQQQQQQRAALAGASSGALLGRAGSTGSFTGLLDGAGTGGSGGSDWNRALPFEEFNPLAHQGEGEPPRPLREGGSARARGGAAGGGFSSVQPSPAKPMAGMVGSGGSGSPLKGRPSSSGMSGGAAGSPTMRGGHRRQVSAPFFSDLNPLG